MEAYSATQWKVIEDHRIAVGKVHLCSFAMGYDNSDDSIDVFLDPPLEVIVEPIPNPEHGLLHDTGDYLDPYWDIRPVDPNDDRIRNVRSLWTYGPSYNLETWSERRPRFDLVKAHKISKVVGFHSGSIQMSEEKIPVVTKAKSKFLSTESFSIFPAMSAEQAVKLDEIVKRKQHLEYLGIMMLQELNKRVPLEALIRSRPSLCDEQVISDFFGTGESGGCIEAENKNIEGLLQEWRDTIEEFCEALKGS